MNTPKGQIGNPSGRNLKPLIIIGALTLLILFLIGSLSGDQPAKHSTPKKAVTTTTQPQQSLAQLTQETMLKSFGFNSLQEMQQAQWPSDSNLGYITGFEDVSEGTVRMTIQKDITKEQAKETGITVMAAVGTDLKDLDWIVARGTDGRDVNISRSDVPALRN